MIKFDIRTDKNMINEKIVLNQYFESIYIDIIVAVFMAISVHWLFLFYPTLSIGKYWDMKRCIRKNRI